MKNLRFGAQQLKIMHLLWSHHEMSARDITDALSRKETVAHSTVQTLLRQLEQKKAVGHRASERTFLFYAMIGQAETKKGAIRDFLSRLFQGSPAELAAYLVQNENLSKEDLRRLRRQIEKQEKHP